MREIKLRAWLVKIDWETEKEKPGRMIYFGEMTYCDEYNHIGFNLAKESRDPDGGDYGNLVATTNNLKDVMLSTGLRDKAGREIYEGDIVSDGCHNGSPAKVVWEWARFELEYLSTGDSGSITAFTEELEVIGNIHENPELLGGAERD